MTSVLCRENVLTRSSNKTKLRRQQDEMRCAGSTWQLLACGWLLVWQRTSAMQVEARNSKHCFFLSQVLFQYKHTTYGGTRSLYIKQWYTDGINRGAKTLILLTVDLGSIKIKHWRLSQNICNSDLLLLVVVLVSFRSTVYRWWFVDTTLVTWRDSLVLVLSRSIVVRWITCPFLWSNQLQNTRTY